MKQKAFTPYKAPSKAVARNRRILKIIAILLGAGVLFVIGWFSMDSRIGKSQSEKTAGPQPQTAARQSQPPDYGHLIGQWERSDGGYLLQINGVGADGEMDCAYFDPRPVDVSHAETVAKGDTIELFIELEEKEYPVAAYQLLYHPDKNILTGLYYQRVEGTRYGVTFTRKE